MPVFPTFLHIFHLLPARHPNAGKHIQSTKKHIDRPHFRRPTRVSHASNVPATLTTSHLSLTTQPIDFQRRNEISRAPAKNLPVNISRDCVFDKPKREIFYNPAFITVMKRYYPVLPRNTQTASVFFETPLLGNLGVFPTLKNTSLQP